MANFGWAWGNNTKYYRNPSFSLLLNFYFGRPPRSVLWTGSGRGVGSVSPKRRDSLRIGDTPRPLYPLTGYVQSQHPWILA